MMFLSALQIYENKLDIQKPYDGHTKADAEEVVQTHIKLNNQFPRGIYNDTFA